MPHNSIFQKYLDNSNDYAAIELEVAPLQSFKYLLNLVEIEDERTTGFREKYLPELANKSPISINTHILFTLIREVWDSAYNYGYYDAQTDEGKRLAEITD